MDSVWTGNSTVFRTYVKGNPNGDGKKPIEKIKGRQVIRTFDDASKFDCFGGVLNPDIVDISFDTNELSDMIWNICGEEGWKTLVLENPDNGHLHFFFRDSQHRITKTGADIRLALGVIADIHHGETYIPLRVKGSDRFPPSQEDDDIQEVPVCLLPIASDMDSVAMGEGDGRNDLLLKIQIPMGQTGMNAEDIKHTCELINGFIFKKPLSEQELDVVLREDAVEFAVETGKVSQFYKDKTFLHDKFGQHMMKQHHVKRINGQLHVYKDGIYVSGYRNIENMMQSVIPSLKSNQRTEVMKYLEIMNPDSVQNMSSENLIPFRNGVLNIRTMELQGFSPENIIMNKIPWNWNPDSYSEIADHTLNRISCDNPEIRMLLEEMIGYCFYRRNNLQKSFILTGTGSNGKSTFLEVLKTILGKNNYSELDIGELDDKFSTVKMSGTLANIGDDISSDFLEGKTLSVFKKAVTGNGIKAENKGQDVFFFKPYCKLLFSANEIPRMKSRGFSAIKRRIIIVPFNAVFTKEDPDFNSYIEDDLKEEQSIEYLIRLGVEGLKRALEQKDFTESKEVQDELEQFEKENNPILGWLDDMEDEDHLTREELSLLYHEYCIFCDNGGFKPLSREVFSKQLQKEKRLESFRRVVNGKKVTMFRKV